MHLDQHTGRSIATGGIAFATADCTGQLYGYSAVAPLYAAPNGTKLYTTSDATPVSLTFRSLLDNGLCVAQMGSITAFRAVEIADAGYPFAGPIRIALE